MVRTYAFTSPSGNITCAEFNLPTRSGDAPSIIAPYGQARSIGCTIGDHDYQNRPCEFEGLYLNQLGRTGRTQTERCSEDERLDLYGALVPSGHPAPRKLGHGQAADLDAARCLTSLAWVTCVNKEGHGFTLSREANNTF